MTAHKLTPKSWLRKSTTKAAASAAAFIAAHREFLQTGELNLFTTPILLQLDSKELLPTPALESLKQVVLAHHLAEEVRKAETAMNAEPKERVAKSYVATVYNAKGEIQTRKHPTTGKIVDLTEGFDKSTQAESWADNRLFEGSAGMFCVIEATKLFRNDGSPFTATVLRDDAIGRILKSKKGPVMKKKPKSGGKLGFGVKCKESHCSFSRG